MLKPALLTIMLALCAPASGCLRSASVSATITSSPRLVQVAPGVWVVEDYDRAIYYADGYYWWFSGDLWYRSDYYTGGFVAVSIAPPAIVRIHRPNVYVRYHAPRGSRVRELPPKGTPPPRVRDHRSPKRTPPPPPPRPR